MSMTRCERRRGQVLPFWAFALTTCLGLMFFVANYANQIRWTIRAQNAADVAATGALVPYAGINNQLDLELYAEAVDEVRIRYLNQALLNILNGNGCNGTPDCTTKYNQVYTDLQNAINVYNPNVMNLQVADQQSQGGLSNQSSNAYTLAANGCSSSPAIGDCTNGSSTFNIHQLSTSSTSSDVYACKQVPTIVPAILGLSPSSTFKAIARSTAGLTEKDETFNPATATNPYNGNALYLPNEDPTGSGSTYTTVNFTTFTPTVHFYVAGPVQPTTSFNPSTASC